MASDEITRKQMNELLTALQIKGDVYMKQLMLEKKRVKDLDDALKTSTEQVGRRPWHGLLCFCPSTHRVFTHVAPYLPLAFRSSRCLATDPEVPRAHKGVCHRGPEPAPLHEK